MSKLKQIGILIAAVFLMLLQVKYAIAQQDPLYTQYMDNLLVINPGFAGSKDIGNVLVVARSQWVSFDGAPATRSLSFNSPVEKKNIGVGFSFLSDKIGPIKQSGFYVDYSYFLKVSEKFRLGMGLKAGVSFFRANLTDLVTIDPDPIFDNDIYENFLPNVGVGFYLSSENSYFGLSVPRLIENSITREDVTTQYVTRQQMHIYAVGGHMFRLNEVIQFKTGAMMKWIKNTPLSFDVNALFGLKEKLWLGAMYRFEAAYGAIVQFNPIPELTIGYSYDMTLTDLGGFQSGSHEIMLSYNFNLFQ